MACIVLIRSLPVGNPPADLWRHRHMYSTTQHNSTAIWFSHTRFCDVFDGYTMGYFSLLPECLSTLETWIVRIFVCLC